MCPASEYLKRCAGIDHTLTILSSEAESSSCSSAENLTQRTEAVWALMAVDSPRTVVCQTRTERSLEPEATSRPVGDTATDSTPALWPANRNARRLGLKFHTITLESIPPETSCFMLGLNATEVTSAECPRKERSSVGSMAMPLSRGLLAAAGLAGKRCEWPARQQRYVRWISTRAFGWAVSLCRSATPCCVPTKLHALCAVS